MNLFLLILSIALAITAVIIFVARLVKHYDYNNNPKPKISTLILSLLLCVVIFTFSCSFVIIDTNYSGVKTTFGQVDSETLSNGFNWKVPFVQSVDKVNNKQQDVKFEDKIHAETKKRTGIEYSEITVTYSINPKESAWIYANVSDYDKNLLDSELVGSALKSASKTFEDENATNRDLIEPSAKKYIQKSVDEKYNNSGASVVSIIKVVIANADFEKDYNKAIADKQKAQLESEKQEIQNKKAIAKAEADAKVKKTKAQAEADAKLIKAEADKKANELKEKSITDNILKEEYINKWNGTMPKYVGDSSMMMNIND